MAVKEKRNTTASLKQIKEDTVITSFLKKDALLEKKQRSKRRNC